MSDDLKPGLRPGANRGTNKTAQTVTLRKPHPCGGTEFEVIRAGPETVLKCLTCRSVVRMERTRFERALRPAR